MNRSSNRCSNSNRRSSFRRQSSESSELLTTNSTSRSRLRRRSSGLSRSFNPSTAVTAIATFNATDLKYQKDLSFAPDKIEEWEKSHHEGRTANSWSILHSAHLREIREMREALLEVQTSQGNSVLHCSVWNSIKQWWTAHYDWVTSVAQIQSNYVTPFLKTRIHYPAIIEEAQNVWLNKDLNTIDQIIDQSTFCNADASSSKQNLHELLCAWDSYESNFFTYLTLLENIGIQLYFAYFSYAEHIAFHQKILAPMHHKLAVGSCVHHVGMENLNKSSAKESMILDQWPQLSCKKELEKVHRRYLNHVVLYLDAIKAGVPALYQDLARFSANEDENLREEKTEEFVTIEEFLYPFIPTDSIYQKDLKFQPSHLTEWENCVKNSPKDAWIYIFDAIKSEALIIQEALGKVNQRSSSVHEWELHLIRACFDAHHEAMSGLVRIINVHYLPAMTKRFHVPEELLNTQISSILSLEFIQNHILKFMTAGQSELDILLPALTVYLEELAKYCDLMESKAFVLLCSYYSPPELNQMLPSQIFKIIPSHAIGSLIAHVGKDTFRKGIMVQEGLSQMEWRFTFGPMYSRYIDNIVFGLRALLSGEKRVQKPAQAKRRRSSWSLVISRLDLQEEAVTVVQQQTSKYSSAARNTVDCSSSSSPVQQKLKLPGLLGLVRLDESSMNRVALEAEATTSIDNRRPRSEDTESIVTMNSLWSSLTSSLARFDLEDEVVRIDNESSSSISLSPSPSPTSSRRPSFKGLPKHLTDENNSPSRSLLSGFLRLDEEKVGSDPAA